MKLTLGFSPCPNDTFIFDALINGKLDTGGLQFLPMLEDVQTLNAWAAEGRLDITKLSFPALFASADTYAILDAGAALGNGVGPLLVAKKAIALSDVAAARIAIPGRHTTANFLLHYAFPEVRSVIEMVFSSIEDAVCNGEADLGVLIHENRFTYQQRGLHKVCDLGEVWESREALPIPLGCIAAKRSLPATVTQQVNSLLQQSVRLAMKSPGTLSPFVRQHAQAMDEEVMRKHIALYVNNHTESLGAQGRKAIANLFAVYSRSGGDHSVPTTLFFT